MTQWFGGDVVANGLRLHYYRTGGAKPPVVLCHGVTDDGLCWTPLARALESDYDVIMLDARGHGLSAAADGLDYDRQAADLADCVTALGLARPAIGGHSMGAMTALSLAADYPDLARCVFLEDPPLRGLADMSPAERGAAAEGMRQWIASLRGLTREQLIEQCRRDSPTWSDAEVGPWADSKLRVHLDLSSILQPPRRDWREILARVTCPALLITADPERGAIVTAGQSAEAARIAPSLSVAHLPGAGHNIRRERFDGYVAAVRAFLAGA
jgi:N-formylmaleamate deformylase